MDLKITGLLYEVVLTIYTTFLAGKTSFGIKAIWLKF